MSCKIILFGLERGFNLNVNFSDWQKFLVFLS